MSISDRQQTKTVVTGAAGLVGQNLISRLEKSREQIVAIDKHPQNVEILRRLHPGIRVIQADLAEAGPWQSELEGCTELVIAHAQIGGIYPEEYVRNNVTATDRLLDAALRYRVPYLVNISSSVVNSVAVDDYTETKKVQEAHVVASGIEQVILRPTLMFGWFDRKHVGWLARFMQKTPVFPIPGNGRYLRQPLFASDFCDIICSSLDNKTTGAYNITGQERIDYIDLIYALKKVLGVRTLIVKVPYSIFGALLKMNALIDKNPAFTVKQLEALVTPDVFEVIDWPQIFGVRATPLTEALKITFCDPTYSGIALKF